MYVGLVFSLGINLCVVASVFAFKDLKRLLRDWFYLKFKISRKNLIRVTFFNENKRIEARYLRITDGMIKPKDSGKTYKADVEKVVYDENNIPNLHFIEGNAVPVDIYDQGSEEFASARFLDAAIMLAMVASEAGPLFEFITYVKKWLPLLIGAIAVTALVLGVLLFVVFEMAGNVSAIVQTGTAISV